MNNFNFCNPTRIVFGKDTIKELAELIDPQEKVMMTYGGGSIKANGVYDQVKEALKNHQVIEFGGIEANPHYHTCMKAVELAKAEGITFLLSVGGGSALDATKFIAAAIEFDGDAKEIITSGGQAITAALPIGDVITLPATGSEMNANSVISFKETDEKLAFGSPFVYPKFSIMDPETTYTLPQRQLTNGIVDAYVHVIEQYMNDEINTPLQDKMFTSVLETLIDVAPLIKEGDNNYDARANFMWAATCALNGWAACGVVQDWSTHMIGHELTAFFGVDHAQSLAIVLPGLWDADRENKKEKLLQYAERVYRITGDDNEAVIDKAIVATEEFFHSVGMKTKLADYGIDAEDAASKVSERFKERGTVLGVHQNLTPEVVCEILSKR